MRTYTIIGVSVLLAASAGTTSAADAQSPTFGKLAVKSPALQNTDGVAQKSRAKLLPAPRVTEVRLVPGADGKLHQVCHEIENPRKHRDSDDVPADGETR